MNIPSYRVFFDTSVYIAALFSPTGAAGELLRLAESGAITMVVSEKVIIESDQVLIRKFPKLIEDSRCLWKSIGPEISKNPLSKDLKHFVDKLLKSDAEILCAAQKSKSKSIDCFVTWNTRDFMKPGISDIVDFPIVVPGECLNLFRDWLKQFLD